MPHPYDSCSDTDAELVNLLFSFISDNDDYDVEFLRCDTVTLTTVPSTIRRWDTFAHAPSPHQQPSMSHTVAPVDPQPMYQDQGIQDQGHGTVALDDTYGDESYDYGQYGEGAYDDGSGMIDPNTGMPLAGGADGNKDDAEAIDHAIVSQMQKVGVWQCVACGWETKYERYPHN